jgi:hypothetical protein
MGEEKLSRIRSHWRRLIITLCVAGLSFTNRRIGTRARIHWLGGHGRPRRPERALTLALFGAMSFLGVEELLICSVLIGGGLAIFLNLFTVYRLFPRNQHHGINGYFRDEI